MSSVNKIILVGNLGRKPEVREVSGGQLATFSLATSRAWTGKDGQRQEVTTWHRINVWGAQAALCERHLDKGSQVYVEGSCEQREYTDKDGQPQKIFCVRAQSVQFLGGRLQAEAQPKPPAAFERPSRQDFGGQARSNGNAIGRSYGNQEPSLDEDIPF